MSPAFVFAPAAARVSSFMAPAVVARPSRNAAPARRARARAPRACAADDKPSPPPSAVPAEPMQSSVSATPSKSAQTDISAKISRAAAEAAPEIVLDSNIGGFCSINPRTGQRVEISLAEKESLFLDAMQAYFRGESQTLSNEEFDELKEELTWQGSQIATLSRDEFRFLDAAKAFEQGKQIMPDDEYDELRARLTAQGSVVAIQRGPRCSIRRQVTFSDVIPDTRRIIALYLPSAAIVSLVWLSAAFELTPLRNVDPALSLLIGTPIIYLAARLLTGLVVPDPLIVVGDCPSCGRRTHVFFGNVLNVQGFQDVAEVKCDKCKATLKVEKETNRMILLKE
jgi:hypothetical protein